MSLNRDTDLARDFFHGNQKLGEDDNAYAEAFQGLAQVAFKDVPQYKVETWIARQFRHDVRPYAIADTLKDAGTDSLSQLIYLASVKRKELPPIPRINRDNFRPNNSNPQGSRQRTGLRKPVPNATGKKESAVLDLEMEFLLDYSEFIVYDDCSDDQVQIESEKCVKKISKEIWSSPCTLAEGKGLIKVENVLAQDTIEITSTYSERRGKSIAVYKFGPSRKETGIGADGQTDLRYIKDGDKLAFVKVFPRPTAGDERQTLRWTTEGSLFYFSIVGNQSGSSRNMADCQATGSAGSTLISMRAVILVFLATMMCLGTV